MRAAFWMLTGIAVGWVIAALVLVVGS